MTSNAAFEPDLDVLPRSRRALWDELADVPAEFVLYGDTGLALHSRYGGWCDNQTLGTRGHGEGVGGLGSPARRR
jgi:hypothetical protein